MKKYNDAELRIVRINKNDIVTASPLGINTTATSEWGNAADRMGREDWDAGY